MNSVVLLIAGCGAVVLVAVYLLLRLELRTEQAAEAKEEMEKLKRDLEAIHEAKVIRREVIDLAAAGKRPERVRKFDR